MNRPLLKRSLCSTLRRLALSAAALIALAACAGPPAPSDVTGEPVCSDYEVGAVRTKMQGSLRFPVMLTVLDGSTTVMRTMILGRRSEKEPVRRILLADSDEEYTVQWSQCENERAPRPVTGGADVKEALKYECGKDEVYKTDKLVTKKGDMSTHTLAFVPPPKAECWMSDIPAGSAADAGADAGADASPDPSAMAPDAGADMDAGGDAGGGDGGEATSSDAGSGDAGTGAADAGGDGGAKKKKPASK